jgi:hypothetical protein
MWLEKLSSGVLRVLTPLGPRYLNPSFMQRLYLLWVFRHFETLPAKVLSSRQSRMIEMMCANNQFVSLDLAVDYAPLLGTLEQRPPVPTRVPRRPLSSVRDSVGPLTADAQQ